MPIPEAIRQKLDQLSGRPGVYLMRDRLGKVIYVGKARSLNKRVRSYFQPARRGQMDPKTRALVDMAASLDVHEVKNETEAILLEGKLIKQYHPRYNILLRDDKRFLLLKLTRDPFPRFVLTRLKKPDGCRYFGPFIHSSALRTTLEHVRKNFHIRSCRPAEPGENDHRHCLNDILQHCSAPCVRRITAEEYQRWIERACLFLEGRDEEALQEMEKQMGDAARRRDYERAAILRDALHDLRATVKQSARKFVRDMPHPPSGGEDLHSLAEALGLDAPPRVIEGFDVSHIHGQHTVGSMVRFVAGRPSKRDYRHFNIRGKAPGPSAPSEGQNDDYASMREIAGRRYQRLTREGKPLPDLVLVDGGRGQLNATLAALEEVGVHLKVAGLAKEEEEIYLPDRPASLRLPSNSPALRLLQRVRDESHRFANARHEAWRRRRIRESILDDLPGIGGQRKQALLKHFGSLQQLSRATPDEIAAVPGLSRPLAEKLLRFLQVPPSDK